MTATGPNDLKTCSACGAAILPNAAFCTACGARVPETGTTASASEQPASLDMERIRGELVEGLRRRWPALLLIGFAALFDYYLKGQIGFTLLVGGGASLALLLFGRFQRLIAPLTQSIPSGFVRPLLTAVPVAFLYLARWKGTQDDSSALLTAAVIVGFAFLVARYREEINQRLAPFYIERNRLLARPVRMVLVFAVPILLTFLLVHRNLGDIGAVLGGTTSSPRSPAGGSTGFMIVLTTALSACTAFLLLNEPPSQAGQSARSGGRADD